jgi:hypothetical protein
MWTTTPAGHEIHIRGDKNMSEADRLAMCAVADAYAKQQEKRRKTFEHLWEHTASSKRKEVDKEVAFWWFDAGCDSPTEKAKSPKEDS